MAVERPLTADFRSKEGNTPRGSMVSSSTPLVPEEPPQKQVDPPAGEAEGAAVEELTPAERYRKRLEQAKIPMEEAHALYDSVLDQGFYEEYVRIRTKRAVFRTRSYEEQLRIQTALETFQPRTGMSQEELISRYNLAASLYEWDGKNLKHETDEDFEKILALIRKMPQPVVALLFDALAKFDHKVMLVFSEGATDSF